MRPLNLAREKIGLPASKCVVVEDSMVRSFRVGGRIIMLLFGYHVIRCLTQLKELSCKEWEPYSLVGLRAAMGANMPCIITPCPSSDKPDFKKEGAKAVLDEVMGLGDSPPLVTLSKLFPLNAQDPNFDF